MTNVFNVRDTQLDFKSFLIFPVLAVFNLNVVMDNTDLMDLRWMIPPMVVHPEKIDFRRFV